jgi:multidrug efflux pump subunit AcrA (membrane-fusion protein)
MDTTEVTVLRAQLAEAKAFRTDMVEMALAALTTIGGVAVLLVGFSWFANLRLLEREKNALLAELENELASRHATFRQETTELLASTMSQLRTESKAAAAEGAAAIGTEHETTKTSVAALERALAYANLRREFDRVIAEARYWELKEVPANEVGEYVEALGLAVRLNDDNEIAGALSNLIRLGEAASLPFWGYVPDLIEQLQHLPSKYVTEKQRYTDLLSKVNRG